MFSPWGGTAVLNPGLSGFPVSVLGVAGVGDGLRWGGGDPHIFITVAVTAARGFRAKATGEGVGG